MGSGKTMLVLRLCQWLRGEVSLAVVTNDIYTREDAEFLVRNDALPAERVIGVRGFRSVQTTTFTSGIRLTRRAIPASQLRRIDAGAYTSGSTIGLP